MEEEMRDSMQEMFDTLLVGEPPMRLTAGQVRHRGRQRAHRRRTLMAAGSAATVGVLGTAALGFVPGPSHVASIPTAPQTTPTAPQATPVPTPSPTLVVELPRCDGDRSVLTLGDTDGSVLPDPNVAAQAVLAAAPTLAPGRTFTVVQAHRVDSQPKHPGSPRVYLIFDVADANGTGSLNLELIPQTGASADQRARVDLQAKPFSNCTPATRTDFPDGAVGLAYVAFGTGQPSDTVQHTYYYSPNGLGINAGAFLEPWGSTSQASASPSARPGRTVSMPLTSTEVLAIARVVAMS
jgi:hypothetical protein